MADAVNSAIATSVIAVAVAFLGAGSKSVSSPNRSPGPSSVSRLSRPGSAGRVIRTFPCRITYIDVPGSPWRKITSPRGTFAALRDGAQPLRRVGGQPLEQHCSGENLVHENSKTETCFSRASCT